MHVEESRFCYKVSRSFSPLEPEIQNPKHTLFSQDHWEDLDQNKFSLFMIVLNASFRNCCFTPIIFKRFCIFQDVLFLSIYSSEENVAVQVTVIENLIAQAYH